jgi:hypothetical protein
VKRSRSPDHDFTEYAQPDLDGRRPLKLSRTVTVSGPACLTTIASGKSILTDFTEDGKPRKRGRPPKTPRTSGEYTGQIHSLPTPASQTSPDLSQAPQLSNQSVSAQAVAPPQASPSRTTPQKGSTLKALPTVRDHTTDQLGPEGDEYVARDFDDAGEKKVDGQGYLQGGREYKLRTFRLPGRGEKLFMLATECARTLQYRDSYLLFNKNRSLFKIIASSKEKEELVTHDILPYSYRSRQIAVVTARSMFRQFGSRVIKDGRRVRDDYWEAKAIKQGFTEADPAGEKRPGAARAREAAAAQDQLQARQLSAYGDVVYSNVPGFSAMGHPSMPGNVAMLPSFDFTYDPKFRDIARPRQELTGPPYLDLTRPSTETDMAGQAGHAAEYSRAINQQGQYRRKIVQDYWHRPHEPPVTTPPPADPDIAGGARDAAFASPRFSGAEATSQAAVVQSTTQAMNPPSFPHQQNPMASPSRQASIGSGYGRDQSAQFTPQHQQFQRSSSNLSISQSASQQPGMQYGAAGGFSPHSMQAQAHNWGGPPPQPHQSPSMHRMSTPSFSPGMSQGHIQSPMGGHPSQSPHPQQMQPPQMPQMHHQAGTNMTGQQLFGPGAGLQAMNAGAYPGMNMGGRNMYNMPPGQFMNAGAQQPGQNWGQPGQANQWGQFP